MSFLKTQIIQPSELFKPYIRYYLFVDTILTGKFKAISNPYVELFFNYKPVKVFNKHSEMVDPKVFIGGLSEIDNGGYSYMYPSDHRYGFVVIFKYMGFYNLFKVRVSDFTHYIVDGGDVIRSDLMAVWEKIRLLNNPYLMTEVVEKALMKFLGGSKQCDKIIDHVFDQIDLKKGTIRIRQICDHFNITPRKLQRKMKEETGITAQELLQIYRINHVLKNINGFSYKTLTELSYLCGYYDQAHFIKDFKKITGKTPKVISQMDKSDGFVNAANRNFISLDQ